jgi:hypothetical protein
MAQAYASSLFAGASRHFHFILGHYHEPNGVQFGLLRLDLTPRPAYVALATVGRFLNDARPLGRCPTAESPDLRIYAFRAQPDGEPRDVLVMWAERDVDWDQRGRATAVWMQPSHLSVLRVTDYLGRDLQGRLPKPVTSAPCFVELPLGQAERLDLTPPARVQDAPHEVRVSPVVLQLSLGNEHAVRVQDRPWSEGYAWRASAGKTFEIPFHAYNFGNQPAGLRVRVERKPGGWFLTPGASEVLVPPGGRVAFTGMLEIPDRPAVKDGWVVVRAEAGSLGTPVLAARFVIAD